MLRTMTDPSHANATARAASGGACRPGCGACCIAPSISSPLPGLPDGKPAGVRCPHLDADLRCRLFGRPERPACCASLRPMPDLCGADRDDALVLIARLERLTGP